MSGILSALSGQTTGQPTKCADVVFTTITDSPSVNVILSTTTANAHIFYNIHSDTAQNPVHSGDSAVSPTIRIGNNSGSVSFSVPPAHIKYIRAVAYEPSHLDSNITEESYDNSGGP